MQAYSLEINDFYCDNYTLIGIHTPLNDYKLAYLLNKNLQASFKRANYELEIQQRNSLSLYPVFEYCHKDLDNSWFLIKNIFKEKRENLSGGLFDEDYVKSYLIPEKKSVDYFLKIEGDEDYESVQKTIDKAKKITQIATLYTIDTDTLKSKENLIF